LQTQALVTTLVNLQSKHRRRYPIESFLPKFGFARYRAKQGAESLMARLRAWVKGAGGKIINKNTGERME